MRWYYVNPAGKYSFCNSSKFYFVLLFVCLFVCFFVFHSLNVAGSNFCDFGVFLFTSEIKFGQRKKLLQKRFSAKIYTMTRYHIFKTSHSFTQRTKLKGYVSRCTVLFAGRPLPEQSVTSGQNMILNEWYWFSVLHLFMLFRLSIACS